MELSKFAYLYSKPLGNDTLKIMKNTWKFTKKTWKNHGILSVRKNGNPELQSNSKLRLRFKGDVCDIGKLY